MDDHALTTENLLVTDLVGSTRLLAELGHERYAEIRNAHFEALRAVVTAHGGVEGAFTGDGLLALLPSTVGALDCATALHQVVDAQNRRPGAPQTMIRIGVALGDVEHDGETVHGLPVVEAFRLCDLAPDGRTLCSAIVAQVARDRGFGKLVEFGELDLKGFAGSRAVFELPWSPVVSTLPSRLAPVDGEVAFTGRTEELTRLEELMGEIRAGGFKMAVLTGEPGIGKSRLAAEFARRAHTDGFRVLHGHAESRGSVPLAPFVRALAPVTSELHADRRGRERVEGSASAVERLLAGERDDPGLGAPAERERLFDAVSDYLVALGTLSPVLLVLDDIQFAGADTRELVLQLARRPDIGGVLIVVAITTGTELNESTVRPLLGQLRREPTVVRIDLDGLSEDEVSLIFSDGGAHPRRIRPELVQQVHSRTNGNALYVCEMVRRHLTLDDADRDRVHPVPDSVRELIAARVAPFDAESGGLLSVAAVLGNEFDLDVLAEIDGRPVDELHEALDAAARGGILGEDADEPDRFRFAHPIARDVLEVELAAGRRARLHRRIGEVLEARPGRAPADLHALAFHWTEAGRHGDPERALRFARAAGDHALGSGAFGHAAEHFRRALKLVPDDPLDDDDNAETRYALERGLAESLTGLGDALAARPHYRHAWTCARLLDDPARQASVALGFGGGFNPFGNLSPDPERARLLREALDAPASPRDRPRLLVSLATSLPHDDPQRTELGEQALEAARELGDDALHGWVMSRCHPLTTDPADADRRHEAAHRIIEVGGRAGDGRLEAVGWGWLAVSALERGDGDEFRTAGARRQELAQLHNDPVHRWTAAMHASLESACDGELDRAEQESFIAVARGHRVVGEDAVRFCGAQIVALRRLQFRLDEIVADQFAFTQANPDYHAAGLTTVFTLTAVGQRDTARELLATLPPASSLRRDFDWLAAVANLAMACPALGEPDLARWAIDELEPYAGYMCSAADAVLFNSVSHALAVAKAQLGDDDHDHWYRRAADEYRRFGAIPWLDVLDRETHGGFAERGDT